MRLFEAKKLEDDVKNALITQEVVCDALCMVTQAHVWHWQTKDYAAHKALGDFYEGLQETVDTLAETYMGAGGELKSFKAHEIVAFDKSNTINLLTEFRNKLNEVQSTFMEKENSAFNAVGDVILDIVKDTDKLLYLLSLE